MRTAAQLAPGLASGSWLSGRVVITASILMVAGTVATLSYLVAKATGTADQLRDPLGADFSSFWTAGQLVLFGQASAAYDWDILLELQRDTFSGVGFAAWNYPPTFLLVAAALATMRYLVALAIWQAASAAAALIVFGRIVPGWQALVVAAGFPAVLICLGHGQTGFLTAALLGGGILALRRNEILAGMLFGLLSYKPQLGVLLPFVLMAGGYWRAFASAAATVLGMVALTLAIWGWPVWQAFFDALPLISREVLENGNGAFWKFQSAFSWMRHLGFSVPIAYALQAIVSAGVLIGSVWVWRTDADLRVKGAALITGAMLCSPYVYDYDLVAFGMALALLVAHGMQHGFRRWEKSAIALGWLMPPFAREIVHVTFLPVGLVTLLIFFSLILVRVHASRSARQTLEPVTGSFDRPTFRADGRPLSVQRT